MRLMLRRFASLLAFIAFGSVDVHAATTMRAWPSLAKRPIEDQRDSDMQAESVAPAPVDPALSPDAARLVAQGQQGVVAFDKVVSAAQSAVSRAGSASVSSENWVQAQTQISALDSARYDSVAALAGLDTLYVSTMGNGTPVGTALIRERDTLATAVDRQNDALDRLRQSLRQP
ncbi:MAG TPA: hypothetical protein VL100_12335 [Croceibacterium sp.]|nr:hypothetical protein [Croceibacterium sp.]